LWVRIPPPPPVRKWRGGLARYASSPTAFREISGRFESNRESEPTSKDNTSTQKIESNVVVKPRGQSAAKIVEESGVPMEDFVKG
jgi:hypothetical protein